MIYRYSILILAMSTAFLASCMLGTTEKKEVYCEPLEQGCQVTQWQGTAYDTSRVTTRNMDWYYRFRKVEEINSPNDEWSLSFIQGNEAVLTFTDAGVQRIMKARVIRPDRARVVKGIGIPIEGHVGGLSFADNKVLLSSSGIDNYIGNSGLYEATYNDNMLFDITRLEAPINYNEYTWEGHPTISSDGLVAFFVSDRDMRYKGTEIYLIWKMRNGIWSEPINCGNNINSHCDELTPFLTNDGKKLYFASAGHETVGGYDIFSADISPEFWEMVRHASVPQDVEKFFTNVENLKPPLNTEFDELFPSSPGDADSVLYYSSNQMQNEENAVLRQGGFDIFVRFKYGYKYTEEETKKPIIERDEIGDIAIVDEIVTPEFEEIPFILEGIIYSEESLHPIEGADIIVKELPQDTVYKQTKSDAKGKYSLELMKNHSYEVVAQSRDLFFESYNVRIEPDDTSSVVYKEFSLPEVMNLWINFPTDAWQDPYKYILDSNGVASNKIWSKELDNVAANIIYSSEKLEKIILVGHTDDVGQSKYNYGLGERRVNFIIAELVKRGIDENLLEGRSAGEDEPLIRRKKESLNNYRKRLRRVTLTKIFK
jgi:WD40-like Beta Propeller Repeat